MSCFNYYRLFYANRIVYRTCTKTTNWFYSSLMFMVYCKWLFQWTSFLTPGTEVWREHGFPHLCIIIFWNVRAVDFFSISSTQVKPTWSFECNVVVWKQSNSWHVILLTLFGNWLLFPVFLVNTLSLFFTEKLKGYVVLTSRSSKLK